MYNEHAEIEKNNLPATRFVHAVYAILVRPICLASVVLPAPMALPTKDALVIPIPKGIVKLNEDICWMIVCAATSAVPNKVAKIIKISKAHHSLQIITVPGRPN